MIIVLEFILFISCSNFSKLSPLHNFCKISCFAFSCSNSRVFLYKILFNSSGLARILLISDILNPNLLYKAICFKISTSFFEKSLYPFSRILGHISFCSV